MLRFCLIAAFGFLAAGAPCAQADWFSHWQYETHRDYRRNNCWPQPFVRPDRLAVKKPFWGMIDNGWRRQNLIAEHYFVPGSAVLSEAGLLKIRWIVTQLPPARRTIFVERGTNAEVTAARVDAVQQAAVQMIPDGELPQVVDTGLSPQGWPADYIESVEQKYRASLPAPRIPEVDRDAK